MACHSKQNGEPFAGGRYLPTPFGPISTPNITPDKETGIGDWTDDQFYRVFHEGVGLRIVYGLGGVDAFLLPHLFQVGFRPLEDFGNKPARW